MKRYATVLMAAGGAAIVVLAAASVGAIASGGSTCGNRPLAEVPSPGGVHRAVVFERSCGATTGFSTQVSIVDAGAGAGREAGNAFIADRDHGRAPAGPGGGPAVEVAWRGDSQLIIRHHPLARVFRSEPRVRGVEVRYERR